MLSILLYKQFFTLYRGPGIPVVSFHGGSKKERERTLSKLQRRGGVLMTSYGMLVNNADQLTERDGREYIWVRIDLTTQCIYGKLF